MQFQDKNVAWIVDAKIIVIVYNNNTGWRRSAIT